MAWQVCADGPTRHNELLTEQRYRLQFLREDGRQQSLVMAVIALGYGLSAFNDFVLLNAKPGLIALALSTRALLLANAVAVFVLYRRVRRPIQQDRIFHTALGVVAVLLSVNHVTRILVGRVVGTLAGSAALLGFLYFALRGPVVPRVIFGGVISLGAAAMVVAPSVRAVFDPQARLALLTVLGALNVVGVLSARSFEQQRRRRFEAERRERRANRELERRLQELAVEKERAEAMSRARAAFLAAMSHEFRTPMNAIIGLSDIVLHNPFGPESRPHVRVINDSARALLRLLEDILDFAKIDAQKLTLTSAPLDLRRLVTSVIEMLRPAAAAASVDLQAEVELGVPARVHGDDARLRQVLVNLVGNAIKFARHGQVRLQIARTGGEDQQAIAFRIEDNGVGMTPELIARLFRPFEQGDAGYGRRHGGTGLGLAISKQIVDAMGGDIRVESEPGRGSRFSFAIPLAAAEAETEVVQPSPERSRPPLSLLVVDDHPLNREVAGAKLGSLGYAADLAEDGPSAVAAAARRDYDVVFMDLHMPVMNGFDTMARIREATEGRRAPRFVAMTASVFDEDREACRRAGMLDFVAKPVELGALEAVLTRVAEERGAVIPLSDPLEIASLKASGPLDRLRRLASGRDGRFFERVCEVFLATTRERLVRMRDALGSQNATQLSEDAHTLKSASAALGALEMSERCGLLEAASREGSLDGAGSAVEAIEAQFAEIERALLAEITGGPQATGVA